MGPPVNFHREAINFAELGPPSLYASSSPFLPCAADGDGLFFFVLPHQEPIVRKGDASRPYYEDATSK